MFQCSCVPLDALNISEAGADPEDCTDPAKHGRSLQKVKPRPYDLIITIRPVLIVQVRDTAHEILDPVDVQEYLLSRVGNDDEGFQQTNQQEPIEHVLFGIQLQDGWLLYGLVDQSVAGLCHHREQDAEDNSYHQIDYIHQTQEVVDELHQTYQDQPAHQADDLTDREKFRSVLPWAVPEVSWDKDHQHDAEIRVLVLL